MPLRASFSRRKAGRRWIGSAAARLFTVRELPRSGQLSGRWLGRCRSCRGGAYRNRRPVCARGRPSSRSAGIPGRSRTTKVTNAVADRGDQRSGDCRRRRRQEFDGAIRWRWCRFCPPDPRRRPPPGKPRVAGPRSDLWRRRAARCLASRVSTSSGRLNGTGGDHCRTPK